MRLRYLVELGQGKLSYAITMDKNKVLEIVTQCRLVAIVRLDDLSCATELTRAMLEGGVRAIEFTLTNAETPAVVAKLLGQFAEFSNGQATIGIGSVRTLDEAKLATDNGAQFLVSPITVPAIIEFAVRTGTASMPGAYTPTEIYAAYQHGADVVKVFPAKALGPGYFKDVLAPMPFLKMMPTGGVDLQNMSSYFSAGAVAVGIGSQLISSKSVAGRDWATIREAARLHAESAKVC